ncbi:hypothetical protein HG536_0D01040 [Torulaspora globosa]|uniref:AAA+ ATPase domain-containing protein n=1 Tax=Torulaspora globosa TaxID=48254 RepID=A0A7G3ZGE6_9SACH|nr:uncharacterized protein HG536_0D01040 [Torulaspora globosa]QLL32582.1 hypothetical protein HG536_0D01040 [Torulaspora globosa]
MTVEKFNVPSNFTLLQCLELLQSIVANRLENYQQQRATQSSNAHNLNKRYKLLDDLLTYLQDGIRRIERYYNCREGLSTAVKGKGDLQVSVDDLQILEHDVRLARKDCRNRLEIIERQGQSGHGKGLSISSIWRSHGKKGKSKAEKEEKAATEAVEKIMKARQLDEQKKLDEQERRRNEEEAQREKRIEAMVRQQVESELSLKLQEERKRQRIREEEERRRAQNETRSASSSRSFRASNNDRHSLLVNGRRSLDIRSPVSRSLDDNSAQPKRKSLDMQDIGKAAQLAWIQSQPSGSRNPVRMPTSTRKPHRSPSRNPQSPASPSIGSKKRYEYTQPLVNRQHIKAPKKTNGLSREVAKETTATEAKNKKESVSVRKPPPILEPPRSGSRSPSSPAVLEREATPELENELDHLSPMERRIKKVMATLHGVDVQQCEQIKNEILVMNEEVHWDDIAGLSRAKSSLKETVVYPFLRPDLFKGLREPIRGMLLFGPPGTGKTMIAKAVATESKSTFFSISASSLLSKYLGESEKLVKALFYLARRLAPSIIFIDEIDSLLTARSDNENESSRRIKTELLIQWSALSSATAQDHGDSDSRVLVLAATNLPWAIDEAARRRFSRRLYIPLPEYETRLYHLKKLMSRQKNGLTDTDFEVIAEMSDGFSGSDITALAKEAAMEPIRDLGDNLVDADFNKIRGVMVKDFEKAMQTIKRSVSPSSLQQYRDWAAGFGSTGA